MKKEATKIRWGIVGAGSIVDRWIKGAKQLGDEMEVVAVASRTREKAEAAAARYQIPEACTYEELFARDDIDVYYIAVPHTSHKEFALKALKRGKAVLVEKPAGIRVDEFEEMEACAREHNAFLMEAVWTWFFPVVKQVCERIRRGDIGDVRLVQAAFSFRGDGDIRSRLYNPETAGGSLLDTGVYDLHFAQMIFGRAPETITGLASFDTDELHLQVDEQASYIARYDGGELAVLTSAVRTSMPDTAYIYGTKGRIVVPVFWKPSQYQVVIGDQVETVSDPVPQNVDGIEDEGYQFEIAHVNECVRNGVKESPVVTFERSKVVLRQCDELRRQWGFVYPCER